jgi:hypothetical protein
MQERGIATGKAHVMHLFAATAHDAVPFPPGCPGTLTAGEAAR